MKTRIELIAWLSDRHTQAARIVDMAITHAASHEMSTQDAIEIVMLPHERSSDLYSLVQELYDTYRQQARLILDATKGSC